MAQLRVPVVRWQLWNVTIPTARNAGPVASQRSAKGQQHQDAQPRHGGDKQDGVPVETPCYDSPSDDDEEQG